MRVSGGGAGTTVPVPVPVPGEMQINKEENKRKILSRVLFVVSRRAAVSYFPGSCLSRQKVARIIT